MRLILIATGFMLVIALAVVTSLHYLIPPETPAKTVAVPAKPARKPTPLVPDGEPMRAEVAPAPPVSGPEVEHESKVHARCQELMDLAMNDDQESLKTIWQELRNPEKDIRAGALEAVIQFGDRSKVQALRELAESTEDAEEKAKIAAAADQLALPPMNLTPGATQVETPLPPQTKGY